MNNGIVTEIERYSIHDGPGIRSVIFLKGCSLNCKWCCNPETIEPMIVMGYFKDKCLKSGRCEKSCPYGAIVFNSESGPITNRNICNSHCFGFTEIFPCVQHCLSGARRNIGIRMEIEDIVREVEKDRSLYDKTGGGVTVSGGEISSQPSFTINLLRQLKNEWFHVAIETNGMGKTSYYNEIAKYIDFVFLDLKSTSNEKHQKWIGSKNTLILKNASEISSLSKIFGFKLVIRTPVIPGFNDSDTEIEEIVKFIKKEVPNSYGLELLPYHKLGQGKYQTIGETYSLQNIDPISQSRISELEKLVEKYDLNVIHF